LGLEDVDEHYIYLILYSRGQQSLEAPKTSYNIFLRQILQQLATAARILLSFPRKLIVALSLYWPALNLKL
jgi:hypothetical protein